MPQVSKHISYSESNVLNEIIAFSGWKNVWLKAEHSIIIIIIIIITIITKIHDIEARVAIVHCSFNEGQQAHLPLTLQARGAMGG